MQVTVNAYLGAPLTEAPPAILDLCRQLVDRSAEFEQQRYVSADYARHMARENLFRMFVPKSLGGPEMSLPVGLSCLETLGQYDGAIAWISMIGTTSALAASYLPPDLARTIFAGTGEADGAIYGGIFAPNGRAHPCALGDGFRLSGRWSWASGSANADWMILGGLLGARSDTPAGERVFRFFAVPRADIILHDTWHALGLRATSSGDISVEDALITTSHCFDLLADAPQTPSAITHLPYFGVLALGIGGCALGNALGAARAFETLVREGSMAGQSRIQSAYGELLGAFLAARAFYWRSVETIWRQVAPPDERQDQPHDQSQDQIVAGNEAKISPEDRAVVRLAATQAVRVSLETIRGIHDLVGGRAVYEAFPFQKHLRDAETMSQHMMTALPSYTLAGRVWLGGYTPDLQL